MMTFTCRWCKRTDLTFAESELHAMGLCPMDPARYSADERDKMDQSAGIAGYGEPDFDDRDED